MRSALFALCLCASPAVAQVEAWVGTNDGAPVSGVFIGVAGDLGAWRYDLAGEVRAQDGDAEFHLWRGLVEYQHEGFALRVGRVDPRMIYESYAASPSARAYLYQSPSAFWRPEGRLDILGSLTGFQVAGQTALGDWVVSGALTYGRGDSLGNASDFETLPFGTPESAEVVARAAAVDLLHIGTGAAFRVAVLNREAAAVDQDFTIKSEILTASARLPVGGGFTLGADYIQDKVTPVDDLRTGIRSELTEWVIGLEYLGTHDRVALSYGHAREVYAFTSFWEFEYLNAYETLAASWVHEFEGEDGITPWMRIEAAYVQSLGAFLEPWESTYYEGNELRASVVFGLKF